MFPPPPPQTEEVFPPKSLPKRNDTPKLNVTSAEAVKEI